ncbi:MAG: cellulase family glycosylhydrolase [Acidimicrobiales bacterium]
MSRRRLAAGLVALLAFTGSVIAAAPGGATTTVSGTRAAAGAGAAVTDAVALRPLSTSADHRIVDDLGRDVLLRGANVNSLGEYWQGVPSVPPTLAVTDADWAAMAAHGLSVVRLLVTWSRIEPQRGVIDESYLDLVDQAVLAAARHGIYSIVDMHQDAYSAFVATTDPGSCPPGTGPGKGWDGAPAWATITDGASTCTTGDRYAAPAVTTAFTSFYENRDGIRDRFVATWGAVSARFAGRPEVAGFDFLNEPPATMPAAQLEPLYDQLLRDGVAAIRDAEAAAGATFHHLIVVEPAVGFADPSLGIVIPDPARLGLRPEGFVAGPHNYAESIGLGGLDVTVEQLNQLYVDLATARACPPGSASTATGAVARRPWPPSAATPAPTTPCSSAAPGGSGASPAATRTTSGGTTARSSRRRASTCSSTSWTAPATSTSGRTRTSSRSWAGPTPALPPAG